MSGRLTWIESWSHGIFWPKKTRNRRSWKFLNYWNNKIYMWLILKDEATSTPYKTAWMSILVFAGPTQRERKQEERVWWMGKKRGFFGKISDECKWSWKLVSCGFRWMRRLRLQLSFVDDVVFRIMYVVEAIVLVATLCFFYLLFGCHI